MFEKKSGSEKIVKLRDKGCDLSQRDLRDVQKKLQRKVEGL